MTVAGERAARRLGIESSYGAYLSVNAAEDLFYLGRWGEAVRRLEAIDPERLEPSGRQFWLSVAGRLDSRAGGPTAAASTSTPRSRCSRWGSGPSSFRACTPALRSSRCGTAGPTTHDGSCARRWRTRPATPTRCTCRSCSRSACARRPRPPFVCRRRDAMPTARRRRRSPARLEDLTDVGEGRSCPPHANGASARLRRRARTPRRPAGRSGTGSVRRPLGTRSSSPTRRRYARLREGALRAADRYCVQPQGDVPARRRPTGC